MELKKEECSTIAESSTRKLHIDMLEGIDLDLYPPHKTHYLAYALQFGLKPPNAKSMSKSETKNQKKAGNDKVDQVVGRVRAVRPFRKVFVLPNRFGDQPVKMPVYYDRRRRGAARVEKKVSKLPIYRKGQVYPKRQPISYPEEVVRKYRVKKSEKTRKKAFMIHSPEQIQLKAERTKFMQEIQIYRKKIKGEGSVEKKMFPEKKVRSQQMIKKKARQKQRRTQKHELIKSNRKALVDIFGDVVFKSGWPISRKEIKLALGLKEEEHDKQAFLGEFLDMVKMTEEDYNKKIKLQPRAGDVSRMLIVGAPVSFKKQEEKSYEVKQSDIKLKGNFKLKEDDFPSLL